MDKVTDRTLRNISANVPLYLADNVVRETVDDTEEKFAIEALRHGNLPLKTQNKLKMMIERGDFRRYDTEINEDVVKELDDYHTAMIQKAADKGLLGDPSKDSFIQERAKRIEEMKKRVKT